MEYRTASGLVVAAAISIAAGDAKAASETVFNGVRYRCTNTCVVNVDTSGNWAVTDCCGGRVNTVINPTRPPDCNQNPHACGM